MHVQFMIAGIDFVEAGEERKLHVRVDEIIKFEPNFSSEEVRLCGYIDGEWGWLKSANVLKTMRDSGKHLSLSWLMFKKKKKTMMAEL